MKVFSCPRALTYSFHAWLHKLRGEKHPNQKKNQPVDLQLWAEPRSGNSGRSQAPGDSGKSQLQGIQAQPQPQGIQAAFQFRWIPKSGESRTPMPGNSGTAPAAENLGRFPAWEDPPTSKKFRQILNSVIFRCTPISGKFGQIPDVRKFR